MGLTLPFPSVATSEPASAPAAKPLAPSRAVAVPLLWGQNSMASGASAAINNNSGQ